MTGNPGKRPNQRDNHSSVLWHLGRSPSPTPTITDCGQYLGCARYIGAPAPVGIVARRQHRYGKQGLGRRVRTLAPSGNVVCRHWPKTAKGGEQVSYPTRSCEVDRENVRLMGDLA